MISQIQMPVRRQLVKASQSRGVGCPPWAQQNRRERVRGGGEVKDMIISVGNGQFTRMDGAVKRLLNYRFSTPSLPETLVAPGPRGSTSQAPNFAEVVSNRGRRNQKIRWDTERALVRKDTCGRLFCCPASLSRPPNAHLAVRRAGTGYSWVALWELVGTLGVFLADSIYAFSCAACICVPPVYLAMLESPAPVVFRRWTMKPPRFAGARQLSVAGESDRDTDGNDGYVYNTSSPNLYLNAPVGVLPRRDRRQRVAEAGGRHGASR